MASYQRGSGTGERMNYPDRWGHYPFGFASIPGKA